MDKNKLKTAFTKLTALTKELFEVAPELAPLEMMEATLKDGRKVKVSGELAEGSSVLLVAEDGSEMPAPDGELVFEDGSVITVKDGMIESVVPVTPEAAPEVGMTEEFNQLKSSYTELEEKYKALLAESIKSKEESVSLRKEFSKLKEVQAATLKVVEELAALPAEEPTEKKPIGFSKESKLDAIVSGINQLKKN